MSTFMAQPIANYTTGYPNRTGLTHCKLVLHNPGITIVQVRKKTTFAHVTHACINPIMITAAKSSLTILW